MGNGHNCLKLDIGLERGNVNPSPNHLTTTPIAAQA